MDATSASKLVSDLEGLAASSSLLPSSPSERKWPSEAVVVPSLQQFYEIGLLLFQVDDVSIDASVSNDMFTAFQQLVDTIPQHTLQSSFTALCHATKTLLKQSPSLNDVIPTSQSLAGLFCHSPRLRHVAYSRDWMSALAAMYDRFVLGGASQRQKDVLMSCLSGLILDGIFQPTSVKDEASLTPAEELVLEAIRAMEEESTDCLRDLQLWQARHEPDQRTLESCVREYNGDAVEEDVLQQREYIYSMLESARHNPSSAAQAAASQQSSNQAQGKPSTTNSKRLPPPQVSAADELERRIKQVQSILPNLGEGFIETALSLYQGDVETTVSTLLNDPTQYPTALMFLDPKLPRRKKERSAEEAVDSAEARRLVKERVAMQEKEEQERYKALLYVTESQMKEAALEDRDRAVGTHRDHDEYDDDYDDQYDDSDIRLGNADSGFSDNNYTYEQIRMYNQIVREDEAEDSFWDGNRNVNRGGGRNGADGGGGGTLRSKSPHKSDDDDGGNTNTKQYRGPNKIKGGRVVGPDGKIVRNPGGVAKKKGNNPNNNPGLVKQAGNQGKERGEHQGQGAVSNGTNLSKDNVPPNQQDGAPTKPNKPRTKPKSDNRMNRQRDKKQTRQGTFGVQE